VLQAAASEADPMQRKKLLAQWALSLDPLLIPDMLARIEQLAGSELQSAFRVALLSRWAEKDPAAAMQAALIFTGGERPSEAGLAVLGVWAKRDLAGAMSWFGQYAAADQLHQDARQLLVEAVLAGYDAASVVSWMESSMPEPVRQELYGPLFRQWAKTDPAEASALLLRFADPLHGNPESAPMWNDLVGQVAAQWANADVSRAVAWAGSLPDGPAKSHALKQVSYRWAETDPAAAAAYAHSQGNYEMLTTVVGTWTDYDPGAASVWVAQLPAGAERDQAMTSLAAAWAQKDPVAAANYAAGLPPGSAQDAAVISVVSAWAQTEPKTVLAWMRAFPEGPLRERAFHELLVPWAGSDLEGASAWLQTLPAGLRREEAVSTFVSAIDGVDPASAFQWAATIVDEGRRLPLMQSAARAWLTTHPGAAQHGIAQSVLPERLKKDLLGSIPPLPP